jgi:hypothetical protein
LKGFLNLIGFALAVLILAHVVSWAVIIGTVAQLLNWAREKFLDYVSHRTSLETVERRTAFHLSSRSCGPSPHASEGFDLKLDGGPPRTHRKGFSDVPGILR